MPSSNATCLQATYFITFVIEFTVMKTFYLEAVFRKAVVFANNTIQSSLKELVILFLELLITWDGCDEIIFVWKGWYCIVIENYEHCYGYLMCSFLRVTHQELIQSSLKPILWNIKFRLEINEFQKWKEI